MGFSFSQNRPCCASRRALCIADSIKLPEAECCFGIKIACLSLRAQRSFELCFLASPILPYCTILRIMVDSSATAGLKLQKYLNQPIIYSNP
nr:hypothetical protein Iba_chr14dCG15780 [Ipomoea batatas]GME04676.1 hypothetical protein Iba_scaffold2300CG0880 [Ipomoea batatas]